MTGDGTGETLWIAGCLVFVFEGLVLALIPGHWQKWVAEAAKQDPGVLRWIGIGAMLIGWFGVKLAGH